MDDGGNRSESLGAEGEVTREGRHLHEGVPCREGEAIRQGQGDQSLAKEYAAVRSVEPDRHLQGDRAGPYEQPVDRLSGYSIDRHEVARPLDDRRARRRDVDVAPQLVGQLLKEAQASFTAPGQDPDIATRPTGSIDKLGNLAEVYTPTGAVLQPVGMGLQGEVDEMPGPGRPDDGRPSQVWARYLHERARAR